MRVAITILVVVTDTRVRARSDRGRVTIAEQHAHHLKDEAIATPSKAIITRFFGGTQDKTLQSICTIHISL
jgi:hypothetical protein